MALLVKERLLFDSSGEFDVRDELGFAVARFQEAWGKRAYGNEIDALAEIERIIADRYLQIKLETSHLYVVESGSNLGSPLELRQVTVREGGVDKLIVIGGLLRVIREQKLPGQPGLGFYDNTDSDGGFATLNPHVPSFAIDRVMSAAPGVDQAVEFGDGTVFVVPIPAVNANSLEHVLVS